MGDGMKDISIFVSSTFMDMQSERDLLRERVLPELEDYAKKYGVNVNFIDLRWGIDTTEVGEEQSTRLIIKSCVDEIEISKPYFISLIGERYGWIPDFKYILNALYSLDVEGETADEFRDISITEFEIRVADMLSKADIRALYMLRGDIDYRGDEESRRRLASTVSADLQRIAALKKRIRAAHPETVFDYHAEWDKTTKRIVGLDKFCDIVTEQLKALIDADFAGSCASGNWIEEFEGFQESFIARSNAVFRGRDAELSDITARVDGKQKIYLISGESGNGKSSLVAKLTELLKDKGEVYSFFTGVHHNATSVRAMLLCFIHALTGEYSDLDSDAAIKSFYAELKKLDKDKTHYFVIDAVNQMDGDSDFESLAWLSERLIPDNVKLIVSTTPDFYMYKKLCDASGAVIKLGGLASGDIVSVSDAYFKKNHKSAPKDIVDAIAKKFDAPTGSPLQLKFLLNKVINLNSDDFERIENYKSTYSPAEAISVHIREIIADTPSELGECYARFIADIRGMFAPGFADLALMLIAYSNYGFPEKYIARVAEDIGIAYSSAEFSYLVKLLREALFSRNFVYDFNHLRVKRIVRDMYQADERRPEVLRSALKLLRSGDADAEFVAHEYLRFAILCDDYTDYVQYLQNHSADPIVIKEFVAAFNEINNMPYFEKLAAATDDNGIFLRLVSGDRFGLEPTKHIATALLNNIYGRERCEGDDKKIYDVYMTLAAYFYRRKRYEESLNLLQLLRRFVEKKCKAADAAEISDADRFRLYTALARSALKEGRPFVLLSATKKLAFDDETLLASEKLDALDILIEASGTYTDYGRGLILRERTVRQMADMARLISTLPPEELAPRFLRLCEFVSKNDTAAAHPDVTALVDALAAVPTENTVIGAELCLALGKYYYGGDRNRSREYIEKARGIIEQAPHSETDIGWLRVRYCILKAWELFSAADDKSKRIADLKEELALLRAIENTYYEPDVIYEQMRVRKELKRLDRKSVGDGSRTFKKALSLSRGIRTDGSKQVGKISEFIVVLFLFAYMVIPMTLFLIWGDYFALLFSRPTFLQFMYDTSAEPIGIRLVFRTLDNIFQTVYSLVFCILIFAVMFVLQSRNAFADRREWAIKAMILLVAVIVVDILYYYFSVYYARIFDRGTDYVETHSRYKYPLAIGFTLIVYALYELYLFYRDELKKHSAEERYLGCVSGFSAYAFDMGVRLAFMAVTCGAYMIFMQRYLDARGGTYNFWTANGGAVFPSVTAFLIVMGVIAAFVAARLIYTLILRRRLKREYE